MNKPERVNDITKLNKIDGLRIKREKKRDLNR